MGFLTELLTELLTEYFVRSMYIRSTCYLRSKGKQPKSGCGAQSEILGAE